MVHGFFCRSVIAGNDGEHRAHRGDQFVCPLGVILDTAVQSAPSPSSEAIACAVAEIDALALDGEPDIEAVATNAGPIAWPTSALFIQVAPAGGMVAASAEVVAVPALLAWWDRDGLVSRITALIQSRSDDENAIASGQRPKMVADLRADLLEVERTECSGVEAAGTDDYRTDTDPRALLGLADCCCVAPHDHRPFRLLHWKCSPRRQGIQ